MSQPCARPGRFCARPVGDQRHNARAGRVRYRCGRLLGRRPAVRVR